MPEAERCVQAHLAGGMIPPPQLVDGTTREPITPSAVQVVDALLRNYFVESLRDLLAERRPFERGQDFALSTAELLASYRRSLGMRTGPATITIPLLGVTSNIQEPHPLGEQVHLRPLPSAERARIWEESRGSAHLVAGHLFDSVQFVLRGTYEPGDTSGTISAAIRTEAADVLTALRLYNDGRVGILPTIERIPGPAVGIMLGVDLSAELALSAATAFQHAPYDYRLDAADLSSLRDLVARLQAVRRRKTGLSIALRRFNQSYARDLPEDRVIDLTVALESSLLRTEARQEELSLRFQLRGATLLARCGVDPLQTRNLLRALYDTRSLIVHRGRSLSEIFADESDRGRELRGRLARVIGTRPLRDLPQLWEDICRNILREYVARLTAGAGERQVVDIN